MIRKGGIFGQEVPGTASRARTSKEKNDRGAVGAGSDTPWAVGLAIFPFWFSFNFASEIWKHFDLF